MTSSPFLDSFLGLFSVNPAILLLQVGMACTAVLVVFLLAFVTRDVLLRYESFLMQCFWIVIVFCLPIIGFLLYLVLRPSRTVRERRLEHTINTILKQHSLRL